MMLRKVRTIFFNKQYWCRGWSQNSTQLTMQMKNTTIIFLPLDTTNPCANMVTEQDPFCRQGEDSESLNQVTYNFNATIKKGKVLNELSKYW